MLNLNDTIAALATPVGMSAVAVIRGSGPDSARLLEEIFGRLPSPRRPVHADYFNREKVLLDDVLVTFFRGPQSYSGEDSFEISCHGNPFIAQKILEDLLVRGCRGAEPGEFTQRAFLAGRFDLSQAEAVMDLIRAQSDRALSAAQDQLRGALGRRMETIKNRIIAAVAQVEAYIDFPEEDLPPEDNRRLEAELEEISREVGRLMASSHYGKLLRDGIRTVILGAPNAGKSSLLNRLVGHERALVSSEPGTTRDFLEERILVGPHSLRLIDTAGLNPSPAPLEKLGIEKTLERAAEADLVLLVQDCTQPPPDLPGVLKEIVHKTPTIKVLNKSDLLPEPLPLAPGDAVAVGVSALENRGFEKLFEKISAMADALRPETGTEVVAINARHHQALATAQSALVEARHKINAHAPLELVASDLRDVLFAVGQITGRVDTEQVLDSVFASFCIGK